MSVELSEVKNRVKDTEVGVLFWTFADKLRYWDFTVFISLLLGHSYMMTSWWRHSLWIMMFLWKFDIHSIQTWLCALSLSGVYWKIVHRLTVSPLMLVSLQVVTKMRLTVSHLQVASVATKLQRLQSMISSVC